jgi:hypothetical protein
MRKHIEEEGLPISETITFGTMFTPREFSRGRWITTKEKYVIMDVGEEGGPFHASLLETSDGGQYKLEFWGTTDPEILE